jgi:hypothetical protein
VISFDAPPDGERRRPTIPIRRARVSPGNRGDWHLGIWLPSEAEAEALAQVVNDWVRKRESEAVKP